MILKVVNIVENDFEFLNDNRKKIDKLINLCKNKGFIFQGSEIYGGLANTWDYGPLGVLLKNNIKNMWIKKFISENELNVGLDTAILMNPKTWEASGHLKGFSDPLMDCKNCKHRFRADKLIEECGFDSIGMSQESMEKFIEEKNIKCPECGNCNFTNIKKFNLMFKTFQGVTEETKNEIYLRPETAQGIFVNFINFQRSSRKKIPFGAAQIGKSFRNEITPGNFLFRVREFEQMELEFFCKPGTDNDWFEYWRQFCYQWLLNLGIKKENLKLRDHNKEELSHYSKATTDIEYMFPFGWGELWGIANRGDFDLSQHQKFSGKSFEYFDYEMNKKYIPYVIEPSVGLDRIFLAFLVDSYHEEVLLKNSEEEIRIVLKLNKHLAPYKAAVMPLSKSLNKNAKKIYKNLLKEFEVDYDEIGSIGKRYRRQDEIGTLFCITYDFESENDNKVTIRDRDTMIQKRINIDEIINYINLYLKENNNILN